MAPHTEVNASHPGRRTALRGLGASLAALAALPLLGDETTAKKRRRKKNRKKKATPALPQPTVPAADDRCLSQVEACEKVATRFCQNVPEPAVCRAGLFPCCQPLGTCSGDQSIQCVLDAFTQKV